MFFLVRNEKARPLDWVTDWLIEWLGLRQQLTRSAPLTVWSGMGRHGQGSVTCLSSIQPLHFAPRGPHLLPFLCRRRERGRRPNQKENQHKLTTLCHRHHISCDFLHFFLWFFSPFLNFEFHSIWTWSFLSYFSFFSTRKTDRRLYEPPTTPHVPRLESSTTSKHLNSVSFTNITARVLTLRWLALVHALIGLSRLSKWRRPPSDLTTARTE